MQNMLLHWKEKDYIYKTVGFICPINYQEINLTGNTKINVDCNLGGNGIPISNYAPLSFQVITLFYALDILITRLDKRNNKEFKPNVDFKKRLNALPMNTQTEVILKFCYAIMREVRNYFMHGYPSGDKKELIIETGEFKTNIQVIYKLFGLIIQYIYLFDGNDFNKYDEIVLKQLVKEIYHELEFDNIQSELAKNLRNIIGRLEFDDTFCNWFRFRYISKCESIDYFKENINRQSNRKIPIGELFLNTQDIDEYLIIIQDEKYLVLGSHLNEFLTKGDLLKWKLTGNWIGRDTYIRNYEN